MTDSQIRVLLVDDEERLLEALAKGLSEMECDVRTCTAGKQALECLAEQPFDVLITDLVMPGMDGIELMTRIMDEYPSLPVIILTGHGTIPSAVKAMRQGAFNYILKPYNLDEVAVTLRKAAEHGRLIAENMRLREEVGRRPGYANLIGESDAMQSIYKIIDRVKDTRSTILITGESGTGKELVAKAAHYNGVLKDRPFVKVDCASLTETLLESELFGHVRGAFTGAHRDHAGYFEAANKGTIFLDEIGEFSPNLQTRLLRVLQEGEFSRVGDHNTFRVEVRVIAATNRDLATAVSQGAFREDLFYRLNVITVHMPPLRERVADIPVLLHHFLEIFNKRLNTNVLRIAPDAMSIFVNYPWPGNVRELENTMERMLTFCDGEVLKAASVPDKMRIAAREIAQEKQEFADMISRPYKDAKTEILDKFNKEYLENILNDCGGKISKASQRSGMDRGCFYRLMKKYNLNKEGLTD